MSEIPQIQTAETRGHGNGGADWQPSSGVSSAPEPFQHFSELENAGQKLPPLHLPAAMPVVRDRWERLVTTINIPAPQEAIWQALTDPSKLKLWLALCRGSLAEKGSDCVLDFEDGEFFLCRPVTVEQPSLLSYLWRWQGIGQATSVTWRLEASGQDTAVTVTEDAYNPSWDWQTWNGGGWPGILDQLAAFLRTGMEWRWPWRRMGPYAQVELASPLFEVWDRLFSPNGLKYWLLATQGSIVPGATLPIVLGDASGIVEMKIGDVVQPGQEAPSFLPHVTFSLKRAVWNCEVGGRLWIEPAGWGRSIFQVFHYNWENLPPGLQLPERRILASFWTGAMRRAQMLCGMSQGLAPPQKAPHNW